MTVRYLLPLAFVLSVSGCAKNGNASADATTTGTAAATTAAADVSDDADAGKGSIKVQITGGAHAGTYDIADTDGCSYGLTSKASWGNQFSRDSKDPRELSSVQLIVPDAKAASAGTDALLVMVAFGPMFGEGATSYTINTQNGAGGTDAKGKGTVKVDDRGNSGTVNFDGTTADGVQLKGTIECAGVVRA